MNFLAWGLYLLGHAICWIIFIITADKFLWWASLEGRTTAFFVYSILQSHDDLDKQLLIKYIIIQIVTRLPLLLLFSQSGGGVLDSAILTFKLGVLPCHHWFINIFISMDLDKAVLLVTLQKLHPILNIITNASTTTLLLLGLTNLVLSAFRAFTAATIKSVMLWASIQSTGFIMLARIFFTEHTLIFLHLYIISIVPIFLVYTPGNYRFENEQTSFYWKIIIPQRGLPPFTPFIIKIIIIIKLREYSPGLRILIIFAARIITLAMVKFCFTLSQTSNNAPQTLIRASYSCPNSRRIWKRLLIPLRIHTCLIPLTLII